MNAGAARTRHLLIHASQRHEDAEEGTLLMPTWLITGCSTGLGRHLAQAVLGDGHNAIVTARDAAAVEDLAKAYPDQALAVALDVTDTEQIARAARLAEERFGGVDVLVNNAGYGYRAAVEEGDAAGIATLFSTNFFGPVNLIKAVLPGMRARRRGVIVNVSSISARRFPAGSGYYSASKAALESVSGSLRNEVAPLGIKVIVVEPGAFRTDFAGRSLQESPTVISDYAETVDARRKVNDRTHGTQPGDPDRAAEAIMACVKADNPPFLLLLGEDALDSVRSELEALSGDIDKWQELTLTTSFTA
jgi:NAD(P)-dependent dehydrogenase (short-subunit alcohol dehydrogenase family)